MNSPESDFRQWERRAEQDFSAIQILNAQSQPLLEIIAFHAQQGAEKYLKTYLVLRGWKLKKTHNLLALFVDAQQYDPSLMRLEQDCKFLMPHVISGRYPEIVVSLEECKGAIAAAERIRAEVLKRLPDSHA